MLRISINMYKEGITDEEMLELKKKVKEFAEKNGLQCFIQVEEM